jgi:hypothetical protein
VQGQHGYTVLRVQLLDKYQPTKCKNSSDCTLVLESNACVSICNVPIPTGLSSSYQSNLADAASACATCPTLPPIVCAVMLPACVNEKCASAERP